MDIARPDRTVASAERSRQRFRQAALGAAALVSLLWVILVADILLPFDLRLWGVRPREPLGLIGLLTMPLLHGGVAHLMANSLPTLLLTTGLFYFYPHSAIRVACQFWFLPGAFVWLVGDSGSTHYGASGINFALLAYLGVGGLLRREAGTLALSLAVLFYYGGMLSGVVPVQAGISWEAHLGGVTVGLILAIAYRHWDIPPRKHYDWEEDRDDDETDPTDTDDIPGQSPYQSLTRH